MQRRTLLQLLLAGGVAGMFPLQALPSLGGKSPVLVLVELSGGNDSLNTVIPLEQMDDYRALRPQIGLEEDELIRLDERFAFHKALQPLQPLWEEGSLALVHGVGYPDPNRSHFRGIEIWDTASSADEYRKEGWAADYARELSTAPVDALVFGRNAAPVMGGQSRYIHLNHISQLVTQAGRMERINPDDDNAALLHLVRLNNDLSDGAKFLVPRLQNVPRQETAFPATEFGSHLAEVARVIPLNLGIPFFKVALGGFDTHRSQKPVHGRLLGELATGLAALYGELKRTGHWDRVTVVTYSEFGRRAAQNSSGGTDHGTAATHFVMGGAVKGGHVGEHPDLGALVDHDMAYSTDFRALYQTLLQKWWRRSDMKIDGGEWAALPLFHAG